MRIDKSYIECLKNLALREQMLEWCGEFRVDGKELVLEVDNPHHGKRCGNYKMNRGELVEHNGKVRGRCQSNRSPFKWHTHASGLYAYPSLEDIIAPLRAPDGMNLIHLIFTQWGVWEMQVPRKFRMLKYEKVEGAITDDDQKSNAIIDAFKFAEYNSFKELSIDGRSIAFDNNPGLITNIADRFCRYMQGYVRYATMDNGYYLKFTPYCVLQGDYEIISEFRIK